MSTVELQRRSEITLRGILLGVAITCVFTAAQVYLGLRIGLTFATSIPAAVISMALLRGFSNTSIQENNIVQTIASAAGTLSSVIFVLPGLIMIGWWSNVPFWMTYSACAIGGILGVMYTIPLRRAFLSNPSLPFPEGVAAAEVLKVGASLQDGGSKGETGLAAIVLGAAASATYAALSASKLIAAEIGGYFKVVRGASGIGAASSFALLGAGHLMGITVGIAMLFGVTIAWGIAVPILTILKPMPNLSAADHALTIWRDQVRFIGAGAIGAAALWALFNLAKPVWAGIVSAMGAGKARRLGSEILPRSEQDIPIVMVISVILITCFPLGWLLVRFIEASSIGSLTLPLAAAGLAFVVLAGLFSAAVCGYMAGLIGASNSPISGIAILAILGAAIVVGTIAHHFVSEANEQSLIAYALFVTSIVVAVAVIGNDNLQDLKTGQLVDATPWKQQVALIIGVLAGSAVIPPVLELLNRAYGFAGSHSIGLSATPLAAPQATLVSTLARGVIEHNLQWQLLAVGALIGLCLVVADALLRRSSGGRFSLPPLGVGLAIYLPSTITIPVVLGSTVGWVYDRSVRRLPKRRTAKRFGVLLASGFIVGESLFNVALAAFIVATGNNSPLAIAQPPGEKWSMILAAGIAVPLAAALYAWVRHAGSNAPT